MTRASFVVLLVAASAALAKPAPKPRARPAAPAPAVSAAKGPVAQVRLSGAGQVTFVTATQAVVDRGQLDGVDVGEVLTFKRRGAPAGTCKVVQRSAHNASCTPTGVLRPGDRFGVDEKLAAGPAPIPALPSPTELRLRLDAVERAAIPLHDFEGEGELSVGAASQVRVSLRHDSWMRQGGGPFHRESLGVRLNGVELYKGIRLWADAQVALWGNRPTGYRYPVGVVQPIVRRLEVSWREPGEAWSVALGRTWPVAAPGLTVLDGAQASYRARDGSLEAGAYGGALPDDITLVPSRRWTGGAFAALRVAGDEGS
ncbi:MAG: hypothetical protein K1X89_22350, partial [Myxococcaceae bacterium]|nr:hypothetical protein [Myxococcaceae bacterium]